MGIPARLIEEKRKHQRTEINEPAYVSAGGSVMRCVVKNISPEGAAIDVDNPAFVPGQFRLVIARDSSTHDCRVIWIREKRIGLAFVKPADVPASHG
jgi:PilZ domain